MPNLEEEIVLEPEIDQLANLFRLLSDRTRLNILMVLAHGERNVSSLCQELHLPQPTVSHHLGLLRVNNIISNHRRGKQVFYALSGAVGQPDGIELETNIDKYSVRISRKAI
jgi:DNA-binding transcriptional ArsR family regulator